MKFLVVFVIVVFAIGFSECELTPEQLEKLKSTIKDCAGKEGASDADVQEIFDRKAPSTQSGRCVIACVSEAAGMIKGNKLDLDGSVALAAKINPSKAELAREIGSACVDITDGDRCEAAFKVVHCLHEAAVAKGVKIANYWIIQNTSVNYQQYK